MKRKRRVSLSRKILLPWVLACTFLAAVGVYVTIETINQQVDLRLSERSRSISTAVASIVGNMSRSAELQSVVASMAADRGVRKIVVVEGDGERVIASNQRGWVGLKVEDLPDANVVHSLRSVLNGQREIFGEHGGRGEFDHAIFVWLPLPELAKAAPVRGAVSVHLSTEGTRLAQFKADAVLIMLAAVGLISVMAFGYLSIRGHVILPLAYVEEQLAEYAGEDHEIDSGPSHNDQIGSLVAALNRSIRARRVAENEVRERDRLLDIAGQAVRIGGWVYRLDDRELLWSEQAAVIHETPDDFVPTFEGWQGFFVPDCRERFAAKFRGCAEEGVDFDEDFEIVSGEGNPVWIRCVAEAVRDENGAIVEVQGGIQDITEKKTIADLVAEARQKEQLQHLMDTAPVGVGISVDGIMRFVNPAHTRLVKAHVGKPATEGYVNPKIRDEILERLVREGVVRDFEVAMYAPDGTPRRFMATYLPTEYEGKAGVLAWFVDITRLKEAEDAMREAKELAEQAARTKGDFLANMSHEIRTPMNAIIGMSHLALRSGLNAQQKGYIERIAKAADGLLTVINDILDFSKIESGMVEVDETMFRIGDVFDDLQSIVGMRAEEKGLDLVYEVAPGLPEAVVGDVTKLRQILLNLAGNAVKFTERGAVHVGVSAEEETEDRIVLHFEVRDTGIGISTEQADRLFQPFSQGDSSTSRRYGGSGLGLVITWNLVGVLEGRIWVESEKGNGSAFHFTMPVRRADAIPEPPAEPEVAVADGEDVVVSAARLLGGARLLVVEDDEMSREMLSELLADARIRVTTAANGREAVELLSGNEVFDGVLMDMQMPVMDGCGAARAIRLIPGRENLPIIAMTADVAPASRESALEAGMNDHIVKPIHVAGMFATLGRWVRPSAAARPRSPRNTSDTPRPGEFDGVPGLNVEAGLARTRGRAGLYRRVLGMFLERQSRFADDFKAASERGDREARQWLAHTLKGSAGNIGAVPLGDAAAKLEDACRGTDEDVVETAFAQTVGELEPLLEGLSRLQDKGRQPATDVAARGAIEKLPEMLQDLAKLLAANDAQAAVLAARIRPLVEHTAWVARFVGISEAVASYDFDLAAERLEVLRTKMEGS